MKRSTIVLLGITAGASALFAASADADQRHRPERFETQLSGLHEDPLVLSTTGSGRFTATLDAAGTTLSYELSYAALEGNVLQAHIHFGGNHQSGGIMVFLCSNLGNGPEGTQACPAAPATVKGSITSASVIGPAGQGISAGDFAALLTALRTGTAYANVHSSLYQGGEIRGQVHRDFF